jgi:hypothetical protein
VADPTVTLVRPTEGSELRRGDFIDVRITGDLGYYVVFALYPSGRNDLVYDSSARGTETHYDVEQTYVSTGEQLRIRKIGGWLEAPTLRVRAFDEPLNSGDEGELTVSPPVESELASNAPVVVTFVDDQDTAVYFTVIVLGPNGRAELAYDSADPSLGTEYEVDVEGGGNTGGDDPEPIPYELTITRDRGWTFAPTIRVLFVEAGPTLSLTATLGGESFELYEPIDITWSSVGGFDLYNLEHSIDSGENWLPITSGLGPEVSNYEWVSPTAASTIRVRVTGIVSGAPGLTQVVSSNDLSVDAPSVTVTAPNGGESLTIGSSTNITWTHSGTFSAFAIERSENGGSSWSSVATGLSGAATSYSWTVAGTAGTNHRIRVTGTLTFNPLVTYSDTSNASFTIADVPWVSVPSVQLFFVADDATGTTDITSQSDRAGGSPFTDGGSPFLQRQGGGRRYGRPTATAGAALKRSGTPTATSGSGCIHGMLNGGVLDGLGWFNDFGGQHYATRFFISGGNMILSLFQSGSGSASRLFAHGAISDGVRHTFGWSPAASSPTTNTSFYLDGVLLGSHASPGFSASVFGAGLFTHIGARAFLTAGGGGGSPGDTSAQGAFIGGMVATGTMSASHHMLVHQYMAALPV